jgi:hypothetical protein
MGRNEPLKKYTQREKDIEKAMRELDKEFPGSEDYLKNVLNQVDDCEKSLKLNE